MKLAGSCQRRKVRYARSYETPHPYIHVLLLLDYSEVQGALACNVMRRRQTLRTTGKRHRKVHHVIMHECGMRATRSPAEPWSCGACGTHLYVLDDRSPDRVWPSACALDAKLPTRRRGRGKWRGRPNPPPITTGGTDIDLALAIRFPLGGPETHDLASVARGFG